MIETLKNPLLVNIVNKGTETNYFVPHRENQNFPIAGNGQVSFVVDKSEKGLYYERQATKNLQIFLSDSASSKSTVGSYDVSQGTFTSEASFNAVLQNTSETVESDVTTQTFNYNVVGKLPYSAATPAIGMPAGNRFTVRISNSDIESKSDLPSGNILTVALSDGTTINYNKNALEDDGSDITIVNVRNATILTITIKWSNSLTGIYVYKFTDVVMGVEGEQINNLEHIDISEKQKITLQNISDKEINFVPYKENFNQLINAGDTIIFETTSSEEVLYYLLIADKDLKVSL